MNLKFFQGILILAAIFTPLAGSQGIAEVTNVEGAIVLRIPKGEKAFVQYYDHTTNKNIPPMQEIVTKDMIQDMVTTDLLVNLTSMDTLAKAISDVKKAIMKEVQDKLEKEVAALVSDIPNDVDIQNMVKYMTTSESNHELAKILDSKIDKKTLSKCACIDDNTIPSIVKELKLLESAAVNRTAAISDLKDFVDSSQKCHNDALLYNADTDSCHDATIVDCGATIPIEQMNDKWEAPKCVGDTTLGGQNCTLQCKAGYIPNNVSLMCGADGKWAGPQLSCVPPPCLKHPLVSSSVMTMGSCKEKHALGEKCVLGCKTGGTALGDLTIECKLGGTWVGPTGMCSGSGKTNCKGLKDGQHMLTPAGIGRTPVRVQCHNEYMIINPSIDSSKGWAESFTGWVKYASPGGGMFGPKKEDLQKHVSTSFMTWFKLPLEKTKLKSQLALSMDCKSCETGQTQMGKSYYMSGEYYGCKWWNVGNCDMTSDLVCKVCNDGTNSKPSRGQCTNYQLPATYAYNYHHVSVILYNLMSIVWCCQENGCRANWWHLAPAIGANGKQCVCYKP
eukprot:m.37788 g.37788  ORF g.37788 m.37788 type:complete len:560 (-) comp9351_c0_seq2:80-1759(-)